MNWKSWPYWVRGSFIGIVISGIILLLVYSWETYPLWAVGLIILSMFPGALALSFLEPPGNPFPNFGVIAYMNIIVYVIICAIIGYLYGKIKKK